MTFKCEEFCRSCGSNRLEVILFYGKTPLADRLLTKDQLSEPEIIVPLTLVFCDNCKLVQIRETVEPEILYYSEYPYFSSVSQSLLSHFEKSAEELIKSRNLTKENLVLLLGRNLHYHQETSSS